MVDFHTDMLYYLCKQCSKIITVLEIGSEIGQPFFENKTIFIDIDYCSIENVQKIWPTKMDFGRPNAEIGRKMANGRLLFLALL